MHLRAGVDFAWGATNLSRKRREGLLGLFADYDALVRIISMECAPSTRHDRNRERGDRVPGQAVEHTLSRWEVPTRNEAHEVVWRPVPCSGTR